MELHRPPEIIVVAGGQPIAPELVGHVPTGAMVIAADSGVAHALALGWKVTVAVGDFDSLSPRLVDRLATIADDVRRHPVDKDATDLELALDHAAARAGRVLVVGLEGGRPDHALANLLVAAAPQYAHLDIELALDRGRAFVVRERLHGPLERGQLVSVIPVHGGATVSLRGVRWPLDASVLAAGTTRGISNEVTGPDFELVVHDGIALCITPHSEETP